MKNGYDKFFKEARKVAKVSTKKSPDKKYKKEKYSIPWKLVFGSFCGFSVAIVGMINYDLLESKLSQIEISLFGKAFATEENSTQKKNENNLNQKQTEKESPKKDIEKTSKAENTNTIKNPEAEELNHLARLNERKMELDLREEELNQQDTQLQVQREQLDKKLNELEETRKKISSLLEERAIVDEKKVDTLVQLYSSMKPQQAAPVIENLDEDLAVEVIAKMKRKPAADIMNLLKPEKAKIISEKFTGYRK